MSQWEYLLDEDLLLNLDKVDVIEFQNLGSDYTKPYVVIFYVKNEEYEVAFQFKKLRDSYFKELVKKLTTKETK